ncbi:MAG TPA: pilus assembly protein PilX [Geobacter sp.]|nr:pilus assembly protein PilX [Geobacter sp.]
MGNLRSQQGAALVTALMLTMLSLVIAMALLAMISTGTQVSASQKRYRSSLTAAQGGVELLTREILPWLLEDPSGAATLESQYSLIELKIGGSDCLSQKLEQPAVSWDKCSQSQSSADPGSAPDVSFRLSGIPPARGFSVSTKIIDTVPGNSDRSGGELLDDGSSVAGRDEVIRPQHVPALYNLMVQGAREEGAGREKALLSVMYAY